MLVFRLEMSNYCGNTAAAAAASAVAIAGQVITWERMANER